VKSLLRFRGSALGRTLATAVTLGAGPIASAAQERPDSVVPLEPLVVRVLRSSVGAGSPFPVSVVAGDELRRGTPGAFLEEAIRALPGVQVQNRYNLASGERLAIRGFGGRAQFGIRGIRVIVDGIPATLPDGQTALDHLDLASLGRVELLRGPGAALYGNAAGGVLHFESRPPAQVRAAGELRSSGGSDGLLTIDGSVSGTSGSLGYRGSFSRFAFDGFRRDPVADDGSAYGRATRTIISASTETTLASGSLRVVANGLDMAGENPGSLSEALQAEGDKQAYRFGVLQRTREDIRQGQVGLTWKGGVGGVATELATWGIRRDFEGRIPSDVVAFDRNVGGARATVRSEVRGITLSGGVEVEIQHDDRQNWDNESGDKGPLSLDQLETVRATGLFLQGRLELSPQVSTLAGLRYDRFSFEADDRFLLDFTDDSGTRTMHAVSPSLGVVVEAAPRLELFASMATSFETPTTTELGNRPSGAGGLNPELSPTHGVTVEGGVRGRLGENWSAEVTLFHTSLNDELVAFEVPTSPGRTFYRNAGESRHLGWEVTAEGRPAEAIWLRVAYTRVDARYERYVVEDQDYSDHRIPGLAPHRVDGRLRWSAGAPWIEIRGLYQDRIPVDDANGSYSPAYFLGDVRAGMDRVQFGGLRISPFAAVANALDRSHNTAVVVNAFGGRFFEPGPGRTLQVGIGISTGGGDS
jgi:iron complex outermembrane receptor protein